jgi:hypothetical protein
MEVAMQQDQFEVLFCDLCGTSVPLADLERGVAVRHQAKTIGACCLSVLRQGDSPLANPGLANPGLANPGVPAASAVPARSGGGESRLLPVATFLLAAMAAVAIFLDQKIARLDGLVRTNQEQVVMAQRSDSEVLQGVGMAMDGVARKGDLDLVNERIAGLEGALQANVGQVGQQVESIRTALTSIQQETRVLVAAAVDYRPLFDELRSQLQRQATVLADLRAMPVALAGPGEPAEAAGARPPVVEPADGPAVPEALAAHVKKLGDADAAVRFEAVDALISSKNLAVLPRLLPMARDSDSFVRRLTIEGLRDFKHPDAVEELLVALGDSDVSVAETAWNSLKKLTGQKIPFDAAAPSKDARQRAQQRWQEWWEKNKATFGS